MPPTFSRTLDLLSILFVVFVDLLYGLGIIDLHFQFFLLFSSSVSFILSSPLNNSFNSFCCFLNKRGKAKVFTYSLSILFVVFEGPCAGLQGRQA